MTNATMEKFGFPASLVREYDHWAVLVRPVQVTLGSLVLASRSDATAYAALSEAAFAEQAAVVRSIEQALANFCAFDKINYLMLMMVDPHVHFHVLPRYAGIRHWRGVEFPDGGWPALPDLKSGISLQSEQFARLRDDLEPLFSRNPD